MKEDRTRNPVEPEKYQLWQIDADNAFFKLLTLSLIPWGSGRRPESKLLISLSTRVDSSDDHRPVRHVLDMHDFVAGALFFSAGRAARSGDAVLALRCSWSCSRHTKASFSLSEGSGSMLIDAMDAMRQDGHKIALFGCVWWNSTSNERHVWTPNSVC